MDSLAMRRCVPMRKGLSWLGGTVAGAVTVFGWYGLIVVAAVLAVPVLALCWIVSDDARSRRLTRLVREIRTKC